MAEQDHEHQSGRYNAEKGSDLELLQEILRLQEGSAALCEESVACPDEQISSTKPAAKTTGLSSGLSRRPRGAELGTVVVLTGTPQACS
jgi:hypothetical protein